MRLRRMVRWIAALGAAAAACSGVPRFDQSLVARLRILGIKAEPPEVPPGGTSRVSALVADPSGVGPALVWALCPLTEQSAVQCFTAGSLMRLGLGESVTAPVPASAPPGAELLVGLVATSAAAYEIGFKRLGVQGTDPPNENPAIAAIKADGLPCAPTCPAALTAPVTLEMDAAPGSAQTYTNAVGTRTETLITSWFTTAGEFDQGRTVGATSETHWSPPATAPPGTRLPLWVVLRDNRGGEDWFQGTIELH